MSTLFFKSLHFIRLSFMESAKRSAAVAALTRLVKVCKTTPSPDFSAAWIFMRTWENMAMAWALHKLVIRLALPRVSVVMH